jgi:hypothetical protein
VWGGEHIELRVMTTSVAVEFDCAHGTINDALAVDRNRRFVATGTVVREHGGPIHGGEAPDTHPARYVGVTNGRAMTLNVTLTDQSETFGSFMLVLGIPGRVVKCL